MRLNLGRMPPTSDGSGGFEFPVENSVMLKAPTHDALISVVYEYRQRNNLPVGDIERDIGDYYCKKWPNACNPEPSDHNPALGPGPRAEPLLNRISRWASLVYRMMPRGGFELVTSKEAQARGSTCIGCEFNKSWRGKCGSCAATTSQLLLQIKSLRKTNLDGNLLACTAGGFENGTAIWLSPDLTRITDEQRAMMPERCWRKAL